MGQIPYIARGGKQSANSQKRQSKHKQRENKGTKAFPKDKELFVYFVHAWLGVNSLVFRIHFFTILDYF